MGVADDTGSDDDAPSTEATTAVPPGTATSPPTGDSTDGGASFLPPEPDLGELFECDIYEQDCRRGEKCTPWAIDGGNCWTAARCSPVTDDPGQRGDPCLVEGSPFSGVDTCDVGMVCSWVEPTTLEGTCVAMCTGSINAPTCEDPYEICVQTNCRVLCIPWCNPLEQDCFEGQACYPVGETFQCAADASEDMGVAGDPCEYINVCDPGLVCADAELVPGCASATGCCSPYCSIEDPMPPCLPGQVCAPYYDVGTAPPGYEAVGLCVLP
ncbi:MAG: ribulose phosphate epimerase [Nannocystaceae bacterium]